MFDISGIGIAAAFAAGVVSFLSPCVLPLVPGYVSYVAGRDLDELRTRSMARAKALGMSSVFVLGFSTVFILLGAGAQFLGHTLLEYRTQTNLIGGAIIVLFGLSMLGVLRIPLLQR
ncbi:MAG TPA: cytochrome c biogenesis protein CcdA, partial [Chromatiales bacterium]|nr:cytochrome c biogenesis protein CcdA [Chromatiales bacterium]